MSAVNPTRAEESACTRELREAATGFRLLAEGAHRIRVVNTDLYHDLAAIATALERVSRRVDTERAARYELLRILSGLARHEGIRDQVIDLVAAMERGE